MIGEQHFGLNYGEYAWQAVTLAVTSELGTDVHDTISNALNCPHLAQSVADKCVLGVCVGHATEIASISPERRRPPRRSDPLHQQFSALRLEVFHLISGHAKLVDDDQDGIADHIVDGAGPCRARSRHGPTPHAGDVRRSALGCSHVHRRYLFK